MSAPNPAPAAGSDDPCHSSAEELAAAVPAPPTVEEAVRLAKGFSNPTRLRILAMLRLGEVCVHQIVDTLEMEQSAVSHQLRTLRAARLVEHTKRGRHVYYRLADAHVLAMLEGILSHSREV
ncbi:MAG TPA: metalloregulator ArsR/SmtB family transcription factor [Trueperaceae bacterium]|nr:metalloregulator ArsR/SmtB family transcription factor [Trueperaceae bacterium]